MLPRNDEGTAATVPPTETPLTTNQKPSVARPRYRRNAHKRQAASNAAALAALAEPSTATAGQPQAPAGAVGGSLGGAAGSLLLAPGATPRDAWVAWLAPVFANSDSCYFTGTYSDEYGIPNGLMRTRNVHKDFVRFLESFDFQGDYIVGVEEHQYRDVLHLHAILQGRLTTEQMRWIRDWWAAERGFARALPVLDGCASYVTKYALKGDTDSFEWRLTA